MSDYQKLKNENEKLKEKNKEQAIHIERLEKMLVTILEYNAMVRKKAIGILRRIGEKDV